MSVDPLGEEFGPTVLPDGFMLVLEPFAEPAVLPEELPLPLMVLPLDPVVPPTLVESTINRGGILCSSCLRLNRRSRAAST